MLIQAFIIHNMYEDFIRANASRILFFCAESFWNNKLQKSAELASITPHPSSQTHMFQWNFIQNENIIKLMEIHLERQNMSAKIFNACPNVLIVSHIN